jgi:hypothetical protein
MDSFLIFLPLNQKRKLFGLLQIKPAYFKEELFYFKQENKKENTFN